MPGIGHGIGIPFARKGFQWSTYWNTHNINLVVEGHSFMIPTGRPAINIVDRFESGEYFIYDESGSTIAGIEARSATTDGKIVAGTVNVLVVWIGVNNLSDVAGDGTTEAAALLSYVADRIASGWDVYVYTMTPSTYSGKGEAFEAKRLLFNNTLRAYGNSKYTLLDTDTIDELDDSTDTLYYYDLLHLTWLGGEYAAELFFDALEAKYTADCMLPVEADVPMELTLTSTGDGSGVATLKMTSSKDVLVTLGDNAKFYSNSGGTDDESSTWTITPVGGLKTIYIKCTTGTATVTFSKNKITTWGATIALDGWTSGANSPKIGGDLSQFINCRYFGVSGNAELSGDITNIDVIKIGLGAGNTVEADIAGWLNLEQLALGSGTIGGDVSALTKLTTINITAGSGVLTGDITNLPLTYINIRIANTLFGSLAGKTGLTYLYMVASALCDGDIGGAGTAAVVNGITTLVLNSCGNISYTSGATWSNSIIQILPAVGYGLTVTIQSNMLVDMAVAGPTGKSINFNNTNNASMADTTQGGIWGDFDGETTPSALATAYKTLIRTRSNTITLRGITVPGVSGDGAGFPAGFGDWYRS